jgi:hypothetical protein
MPDESLDPDLAALSAALGGLSPTPAAIDRDRLLYEAGRRSVRSRPWQLVAGLFVILSTGLGVRLATVPPEVQTVYVDGASRGREPSEVFSQTPGALAPGSPGGGYLHLRDQVVRFGADSLPAIVLGASAPPPPVEQMLGLPKGTLTDTQKSRWEHQLFQGGV